MHQIIKYAIDTKPYRVELAVIDYQDDGIFLDVFLWKDACTLLNSDAIATGNVKYLQKKMLETHNLPLDNGVNSEYTLEV